MQRAIITSILFLFICCKQQENKKSLLRDTLQTNSKAQILNGVIVHQTGGLKIYRAFLSYPNGALINKENIVQLGDTVCLNLLVEQGWIAENGFVSVGAMQTIIAENNEQLFSSPDLFANEPKMRQSRAAQLQLTTALTKIRPDIHSLFVQYKVWDKIGSGEVNGIYKLQLAHEN